MEKMKPVRFGLWLAHFLLCALFTELMLERQERRAAEAQGAICIAARDQANRNGSAPAIEAVMGADPAWLSGDGPERYAAAR